jgi:archaellum component FlaC
MELIPTILDLLKHYDLHTVMMIMVVYYFVSKKINTVDKAVNQRPTGSKTISDEVTEINHKMDIFSLDLKHVKKEIDEHRSIDEHAFSRIEEDIRTLARMVK